MSKRSAPRVARRFLSGSQPVSEGSQMMLHIGLRCCRTFYLALAVAVLSIIAMPATTMAGQLKVAVIKFGTVSWEMDVIRHHGLAEAQKLELEVLTLANTNASKVALQAGEADVIVTDWIWVSRQRAEGTDYTFVPYSTALGSLMVPGDSPIRELADLKGRRIGIAGGPLDKSWLLLRGHGLEKLGTDLDGEVEKVFAAAPLLNEQIQAGRLDAVINYWPFAARLQARGYRPLLRVNEMVESFGLASRVPLLGYVFRESLGEARRDDITAFVNATREAKRIMSISDTEWERLRPLMRAKDDATFVALRAGFRHGIPFHWRAEQREAAAKLFAILAQFGGEDLVGTSGELAPGTFWPHVTY